VRPVATHEYAASKLPSAISATKDVGLGQLCTDNLSVPPGSCPATDKETSRRIINDTVRTEPSSVSTTDNGRPQGSVPYKIPKRLTCELTPKVGVADTRTVQCKTTGSNNSPHTTDMLKRNPVKISRIVDKVNYKSQNSNVLEQIENNIHAFELNEAKGKKLRQISDLTAYQTDQMLPSVSELTSQRAEEAQRRKVEAEKAFTHTSSLHKPLFDSPFMGPNRLGLGQLTGRISWSNIDVGVDFDPNTDCSIPEILASESSRTCSNTVLTAPSELTDQSTIPSSRGPDPASKIKGNATGSVESTSSTVKLPNPHLTDKTMALKPTTGHNSKCMSFDTFIEQDLASRTLPPFPNSKDQDRVRWMSPHCLSSRTRVQFRPVQDRVQSP